LVAVELLLAAGCLGDTGLFGLERVAIEGITADNELGPAQLVAHEVFPIAKAAHR
jgi:hypothetical protein